MNQKGGKSGLQPYLCQDIIHGSELYLTSGRCITRWSGVTAPPCPPVHLSSQPVRLASSCPASLSANKPIQALLAQSSVSIHPKATPCPSTLTPIEHYSAVSQGQHVLCIFVCVSDEQWGRQRRRKTICQRWRVQDRNNKGEKCV